MRAKAVSMTLEDLVDPFSTSQECSVGEVAYAQTQIGGGRQLASLSQDFQYLLLLEALAQKPPLGPGHIWQGVEGCAQLTWSLFHLFRSGDRNGLS